LTSARELQVERSIGTIEAVVTLMGSKAIAAKAMGVNPSTIYRWLSGEVVLDGVALVAARAVLRHPEDFQAAKVRRAHD
jgi:hypothetical protein